MAYFPNASSAGALEALCGRCRHQEDCTVRLAHDLFNYGQHPPTRAELMAYLPSASSAGGESMHEQVRRGGVAQGIKTILDLLLDDDQRTSPCPMFIDEAAPAVEDPATWLAMFELELEQLEHARAQLAMSPGDPELEGKRDRARRTVIERVQEVIRAS